MPYGKCPKCGAFTLIYEPELKRYACIRPLDECGYIKQEGATRINLTEAEPEDI